MDHCFQEPTLVINYSAYAKMCHYVRWAEGEVSGFGFAADIQLEPFPVIKVKTAFLLEQKCSGALTDMTEDGLTDFLFFCATHDKNPADYRFWWHSHVNFPVFFSAIDIATIARLTESNPWVSLCMNKRGHMVARWDHGKVHHPLAVFVNPTSSSHLMPSCRRQLKTRLGEL